LLERYSSWRITPSANPPYVLVDIAATGDEHAVGKIEKCCRDVVTIARKGSTPLKRGDLVVAEWRRGDWYGGKIYRDTSAYVVVAFFDGDKKRYGRRSSKILALKTALPFSASNCGPHSENHAKSLPTLHRSARLNSNNWVAVELQVGTRFRYRWEWYIGRILERHRGVRPSCEVQISASRTIKVCHRPEGVYYIDHDAPYILSGPYEESILQSLIGRNPKSPLPKPKPIKIIKEPSPSPPKIGQRIIGKINSSSDGWLFWKIVNIRPGVNVVEILFDNGARLGWPRRVSEFRPISSQYDGKLDFVSEDEADRIWKEFGLRQILVNS
jgi:hypothetical protein